MGLQSICCSLGSPTIPYSRFQEIARLNAINGGNRRLQLTNSPKSFAVSNLKWGVKVLLLPKVKEVSRLYASHSESDAELGISSKSNNAGIPKVHFDSNEKSRLSSKFTGIEPYGGKSGSVSFYGVTHHTVEESKLISSPYKDNFRSLIWIFAPLVLLMSLVLPPVLFTNEFYVIFKNDAIAEIAGILFCEAMFYVGVAIFLVITDCIQRPYLQFSAKRWGLITGLKGHLTSTFFTMGLKVITPLAVTYATWPIIGMNAVIAVMPLLAGYLVQYAFEGFINKRGLSCWPLAPIIFEVYRFYQLTRAVGYVEGLISAIGAAQATPELIERSEALGAMSFTFYVVALACLWSLMTFLLRLFPSRPVAENY